MSKVIRSVKNVTKGYSSVQVKVREGGSDPTDGNAPGADHSGSCDERGNCLLMIAGCSDEQ